MKKPAKTITLLTAALLTVLNVSIVGTTPAYAQSSPLSEIIEFASPTGLSYSELQDFTTESGITPKEFRASVVINSETITFGATNPEKKSGMIFLSDLSNQLKDILKQTLNLPDVSSSMLDEYKSTLKILEFSYEDKNDKIIGKSNQINELKKQLKGKHKDFTFKTVDKSDRENTLKELQNERISSKHDVPSPLTDLASITPSSTDLDKGQGKTKQKGQGF